MDFPILYFCNAKRRIMPGKFITKHSVWIIVGVIIATIVFGLFIPKVGINSDILSFLPSSDPVIKQYKDVGKKFGGNTITMVIVRSDSIFSYPVLSRIKKLEKLYKKIDGIGMVQSLISMIDIKKTEEGIEVSELIGNNIPKSKKTLDSLKNYVMSKEMYKGTIISKDGKYTVIIARIKEGYNKALVGKKIIEITEKNKGNLTFYYSGLPLMINSMNKIIRGDMKKLLPITILLLIIVLGIGFKRPAGILLPLFTVLLSLIWTIGIMGIFHTDFSVVSNIMPVILISIGSAYGIHIISRFYEDHNVEETIMHTGKPVLLAALTTAAGFLSFLTTNLIPIRQFGIYSAVGVLIALLLSVIFLPSILYLTHPKTKVKKTAPHFSKRFIEKFSSFIVRRENFILLISFVLFLLSVGFSFKISRTVDMNKYFKPGTDIRVANEIADKEFGGTTPIILNIKGNLDAPENLNLLVYIEKYLTILPYISHPQSITDLLMETNYNLNNEYVIPEDKAKVQNLWFFLQGQEMLSMMINDGHNEGIIHANLGTSDTKIMKKTTKIVENFLKSIKGRKEWWKDELKWDLITIGLDTSKIDNIILPSVPDNIIKKGLKKYLESAECAVSLPENKKRFVIDYSLSENFGKIMKIGGADGKYLVRDIKTIMDREKRGYEINKMYGELVARKVSENDKKKIKGDLYWFTVNNPPALHPENLTIIQTGMPRIHIRLDRRLLMSQFQSMIIALALVFLMLLWQIHSVWGAGFSIIPILFTVALNFGIMELFHIPLDDATVMIASLTIGMGIDYTIHFTGRLRFEMNSGKGIAEGIRKTLQTTGVAILINAVSVAVGFLALLGANVTPLIHFGILVSGTMFVSAFAAIVLLPALLLKFKPAYLKKK